MYFPGSLSTLTPNPRFDLDSSQGLLYGWNYDPGLDYRWRQVKIPGVCPALGSNREPVEFHLESISVWLQCIGARIGWNEKRLSKQAANPGERAWNSERIPTVYTPGIPVANTHRNDLHAGSGGEVDHPWLNLPTGTTRTIRSNRQMPIAGTIAENLADGSDSTPARRTVNNVHPGCTDQRTQQLTIRVSADQRSD
jgi:hypothetical protein